MAIFGGSRIDNFTVVMVVSLVIYSVLVNGVTAWYYGSSFNDPFAGKTLDLDFTEDYEYSDFQNISRPSVPFVPSSVTFTELAPDREIDWWRDLVVTNSFFNVFSHYTDWWNSWLTFNLEPKNVEEDTLLDLYDESLNSTKYIFSQGGKYETAVFFCPQFYYNETDETVTYLYGSLEESLDNDVITIVCATNASYTSYDVGHVFGILTGFAGFEGYSIPVEVSAIIGGIWWALIILVIVKLVIG